jgi:hypothetical protein
MPLPLDHFSNELAPTAHGTNKMLRKDADAERSFCAVIKPAEK